MCWMNNSKEIENNDGILTCSQSKYQQLPDGIYLNDCKDIDFKGGILSAKCGRPAYYNAISLNYAKDCSDTSEVHLTGGGRGIYYLACTTPR